MKYAAVFLSVLAFVVLAAHVEAGDCLIDDFTLLNGVTVDCDSYYNIVNKPKWDMVYCCEQDGYVPEPKTSPVGDLGVLYLCECVPKNDK
ncbi:hypothetical protein PoB_001180900 [Plakobranchus ocellatus]|uniref:Plethodontid modulating factor n=1 Tax=Plakobranchus ocellatus TaxID=259542 RepID=A0AAV3YQH7_9GAST|nr:hypothetical protein PoB_001180900 [Plakobranchus ocellatus]